MKVITAGYILLAFTIFYKQCTEKTFELQLESLLQKRIGFQVALDVL